MTHRIDFQCACGQKFRSPATKAGRIFACSKCGDTLMVPQNVAAPEQVVPPLPKNFKSPNVNDPVDPIAIQDEVGQNWIKRFTTDRVRLPPKQRAEIIKAAVAILGLVIVCWWAGVFKQKPDRPTIREIAINKPALPTKQQKTIYQRNEDVSATEIWTQTVSLLSKEHPGATFARLQDSRGPVNLGIGHFRIDGIVRLPSGEERYFTANVFHNSGAWHLIENSFTPMPTTIDAYRTLSSMELEVGVYRSINIYNQYQSALKGNDTRWIISASKRLDFYAVDNGTRCKVISDHGPLTKVQILGGELSEQDWFVETHHLN